MFTAGGKPVGSPCRTLQEFTSSLGSTSSGVLGGHSTYTSLVSSGFYVRCLPIANEFLARGLERA